MTELPISRSVRIASALLDHIIVSAIAVPFAFPWLTFSIVSDSGALPGGAPFGIGSLWNMLLLIPALFGFSLYFSKDALQGRSPGKRIMHLQVVDDLSGVPASPLQCLVRNLFIVIWPIETLFFFITPERRLGDRIAHTRIARFRAVVPRPRLQYSAVAVAVVLAFMLVAAAWVLIAFTAMNDEQPAAAPVMESFHEQHSLLVQYALYERLRDYGTVRAQVFERSTSGTNRFFTVELTLAKPVSPVNGIDTAIVSKVRDGLSLSLAPGSYLGTLSLISRDGPSVATHTYRLRAKRGPEEAAARVWTVSDREPRFEQAD